MITHDAIWLAIDSLAARYKLSPSGLAKAAGLDATTFNKSKRFTNEGRERWPSTESLAKILEATGASFDEFIMLMASFNSKDGLYGCTVPLLDMDLAGDESLFSRDGLPEGDAWDEITFPEVADQDMFALEIVVDDYEPVYWAGDILIVSPGAELRRGDKVVYKTDEGEVGIGQLLSRSARNLTIGSIVDRSKECKLKSTDLDWLYRIIWVKQ